jgi:hypothetical protein
MSARILSLAELKSMKGLRWSDSHLGRLEKDGLFPVASRSAPTQSAGWRPRSTSISNLRSQRATQRPDR